MAGRGRPEEGRQRQKRRRAPVSIGSRDSRLVAPAAKLRAIMSPPDIYDAGGS